MRGAFALALFLVACKTRAKEGTLADTTADSAHPRTAGDVVVSAKALADLDGRYAHDWEKPSCEVDTTVAHPAARALLDEYLRRDTTYGYFAGNDDANDAWFLAMVECPGHLGGGDDVRVVAGYSVDSLPAGRDSARYVVRWRTIGRAILAVGHMRFDPRPSSDADTVALVHTPYGWRMIGDVSGVDLGAGAILRRADLDSASREELQSAVRTP